MLDAGCWMLVAESTPVVHALADIEHLTSAIRHLTPIVNISHLISGSHVLLLSVATRYNPVGRLR